MKEFDKFFCSISPEQLDQIIKNPSEIQNLFIAQENETKYLRGLLDDKSVYQNFVKHFNLVILKKLKKDRNIDKFRDELRKFASIKTFRLISLNEMLPNLQKNVKEEKEKYVHDQKICDLLSRLAQRKDLTKKEREFIRDEWIRTFILQVKPMGILFSQISEMFFVFEFNCKIICGMGCYEFARKIHSNQIIQHQEVWKTLRRLAKKDGKCEACFASKTCCFKIDFNRIANTYACMTKIRQLADYSEIFYIHENFLEDLIKYSFKSVKVIHKLTEKIIKKSKFLYNPFTDEDLGITL
jgi:hypothetical protein